MTAPDENPYARDNTTIEEREVAVVQQQHTSPENKPERIIMLYAPNLSARRPGRMRPKKEVALIIDTTVKHFDQHQLQAMKDQ